MPYSLLPLTRIDRVLVTNCSMHDEEPRGHTFQVFRLSGLRLLMVKPGQASGTLMIDASFHDRSLRVPYPATYVFFNLE